MKYIAYGSNMVLSQMAARCPDARLLGTGCLAGARLEFFCHATVERSALKSDRVPVAVWEISPRDERLLDFYEGYPQYYIKEAWPARMEDGSEVHGMLYRMTLIREMPPSREYYRAIADAYRKMGLPEQIPLILEPALKRAQERAAKR